MKYFLLIISGIILLFLSAYWVKCQFGINVFESSLSKYFPFKYLQGRSTHIVENPKSGKLLADSFEIPIWSKRNWSGLWAREKDLVVSTLGDCSLGSSKCLHIVSKSSKDWAYQHINNIGVAKGDVFRYQARVINKSDGDVYVRMVAYDKNMKALNWNYAGKKIAQGVDWVDVKNEFMVDGLMKYIRFGISGSGVGAVWMDDVVFEKMR
ncbi:hypothetical protein MNBD_BACTEROID05-627 [hydrothermal vent metagenome]|uniref:CBM-cenC domain-containing protein n=1 Tax=hydrothermal vent metagenome TaxID=652676 RepID=A0A3B0U2N1_9ZZZZ